MSLAFSARRLLGEFSFDAEFTAANEILVLFGHSGAGKSLTLQFVAGLMRPDSGAITVNGTMVFDSGAQVNLPPQARGVGYVVQELALFDHMNVAGNIGFGLPRGAKRQERIVELLALLDLVGFGERAPRSLSGGQRQRVALARALAREAPVLLLDEPFSALDDSLRVSMRKELLRLRAELGLTILFVTHDLREAHFLADRIAVFDNGRILQLDARETIFKRPASRRVAELTGVANVWEGVVAEAEGGATMVDVGGLRLRCATDAGRFVAGEPVDVMVRAERVNLRRDSGLVGGERNLLSAEIVSRFAYGSTHTLHFRPAKGGPEIEVEIASRPYEVMGAGTRDVFTLEIEAEDLHVVGRRDGT